MNAEYGGKTKLVWTTEEANLLKECKRNATWYKTVPLMAISSVAIHYAVKFGHVKVNPKWGKAALMLAAGGASMISGQFLAVADFLKKVKSLPNSPIGEKLRNLDEKGQLDHVQRGRRIYSNETPEQTPAQGTLLPSSSEAAPLGESTLPIYQDLDAYKPLVDTDYPDQENQSSDEYKTSIISPNPVKSVTYAELRAKNREEFDKRRKTGTVGLTPEGSDSAQPYVSPPADTTRQYQKKKNIYGDVWEE